MRLKWAHRRARVAQMAGLIRSGGRHFRCCDYFSLQWIQGNIGTFSEQLIASIIYDSRRGMCDVAFRTAPSTGGPSCGTAGADVVSCRGRNMSGDKLHIKVTGGYVNLVSRGMGE